MPPKYTTLGIDLGTTFSVCTVYNKTRTKHVENESGEDRHTFPSVVHVHPDTKVMQYTKFPGSVAVRGWKQTIGLRRDAYQRSKSMYDDICKRGGFGIQFGPDNNVLLSVGSVTFDPTLLTSCLLAHILDLLDVQFASCKFSAAVLTVPARFDQRARSLMRSVCHTLLAKHLQLAGECIFAMSEPVAAAMALPQIGHQRLSIVMDIGGGTFDVTVLQHDEENDMYQVALQGGELLFGGETVNQHVADFFANTVRLVVDDAAAAAAAGDLLSLAEEAKKVAIDDETFKHKLKLPGGQVVNLMLSPKDLDTVLEPVKQRYMEIVRSCLQQKGWTPSDINVALITGGSSNLPQIRQAAEELGFQKLHAGGQDGKTFSLNISDGAAMAAHTLSNMESSERRFQDSAPFSIHIGYTTDDRGDFLGEIIPEGSLEGVDFSTRVYTQAHPQPYVSFPTFCVKGRAPRSGYVGDNVTHIGSMILKPPQGQAHFTPGTPMQVTCSLSEGSSIFKIMARMEDMPQHSASAEIQTTAPVAELKGIIDGVMEHANEWVDNLMKKKIILKQANEGLQTCLALLDDGSDQGIAAFDQASRERVKQHVAGLLCDLEMAAAAEIKDVASEPRMLVLLAGSNAPVLRPLLLVLLSDQGRRGGRGEQRQHQGGSGGEGDEDEDVDEDGEDGDEDGEEDVDRDEDVVGDEDGDGEEPPSKRPKA